MADAIRPELGALVRHVRASLEEAGKPDAALDARLLVEALTGAERAESVLDPRKAVSQDGMDAVLAALQRRLDGEPVHRILGAREFYGLTLTLSAGTLEPRPDTEVLVDLALPFAQAAAQKHGHCRLLDLGTGTGAIALALLRQESHATAVASDISADALATATRNADMNGVGERFQALQSRWFEAVEGQFHLIVSNPPYIPSSDIASLEREVRDYDPLAALDGGEDGLNAYRDIAAGCRTHLEEDGVVAVEVGHDQADAVEEIFVSQGLLLEQKARDLGGVMRALLFRVGKP